MVNLAEPLAANDVTAGYRMTELGVLPAEWKVAKLGRVAQLVMGQSPPSVTYNLARVGLPFLQGKAEFGATHPRPVKWCSNPVKTAPPGSILVSVRAPVGDVNIAESNSCIGRGLAAVVPGSELDRDFAFYALRYRKAALEARGAGSTFQSINKAVLDEFLVPLPPLPEQRAIGHILSTVEEAKEATERAISATRELKKSLMRYLFTYGSVPADQAEQVVLRDTEFGSVPAAWDVVPLATVALVQSGMTKGRKLVGKETVCLPYLRVANVQDGFLDLSEIKEIEIPVGEIPRYSLQPGDVLLTEGGDFDKLGRGFLWEGQIPRCLHQNHIFAVRPDRKRLLPEYLAFYVQSHLGKAYFLQVAHRTTHLASINSTKLKALPVAHPPIREQEVIAGALDAVDSKIAAERERAKALGTLLQALLRELLSGRVVATGAD